ncbi:M15 family metallopeptidase [uncultured Cohaesibacter sp.]|uniref:M15 family metallopeptidase n=1 Tax=uncultured Cohaesibacter sp. TaxID=1002546 RepID=UPI0029C91836|nr:M15 family metallopeptidase [uncultured Cohaesibacter sp.]
MGTGFILSARDERLLIGVHPDLVKVIRRAAEISPVRFRVTEGTRTLSKQRQLVASGASKTMNSRHITGHAVDLTPLIDLNHDGKFSTKELYHWPSYYKLAPYLKQAAKDVGVSIEWGGDWRTFKDGPHWQLPWKKYPAKHTASQAASLMGHAPYQDETEKQAAVRDSVPTVALGGAALNEANPLEALSNMSNVLTDQQAELSSGDVIRVLIAACIIGVTAYAIWRRFKR